MNAIIYNIDGKILRVLNMPEELITSNVGIDEYFIEGEADDSTQFIENGEIKFIPDRPNQYSEFNWTTKQWEDPPTILDTAKTDYKDEVNRLSGAKILSVYPTYRQINYNREPTAPATIEMNLWIDNIRAESNIATSAIDSATDLATIEGIVDGFIAYLASL
jgi:hypothetical protein